MGQRFKSRPSFPTVPDANNYRGYVLLPHKDLGNTTGISDHEEIVIDVRHVQIPRILNGLGQIDRVAQNGGALVRLGKSDGAVDVETGADDDLVLGSAEELDGDGGLDAGLLTRDGCGMEIIYDVENERLEKESRRWHIMCWTNILT